MSNTPDNNRPDSDVASDHATTRHRNADPVQQAPNPEAPPLEMRVHVNVDQSVEPCAGEEACVRAAILAAHHRGFNRGELGVRIASDAVVRQLNAQHLGHDYETDVISFAYPGEEETLTGELVVSNDMARRCAAEWGWPAAHELLLYIVHGVLHITGLDDQSEREREEMRRCEHEVMLQLGITEIVRCHADASPASEATS